MNDNFQFGMTAGFITGVVLMTAAAIMIRDQGRDECENKLVRTDKCVQVWVPESTLKVKP